MNTKPAYITATIEVDVPFFDIDSMGIAWHGHYIKYFELARCALLEKFDYDYNEMSVSGYAWPVVDIRVKYVKPAYFKQKLIVEARLVEYENRMKIQYFIFDQASGARLTKAYSVQVAVDLTTKEMCFASPNVFLDKVTSYINSEVQS